MDISSSRFRYDPAKKAFDTTLSKKAAHVSVDEKPHKRF